MLIVFLNMLQCQDGHKAVPHVVSVIGNMDRGMMAFLSNSLQQLNKDNGKQKLQQRKVMTHSCKVKNKLSSGGL